MKARVHAWEPTLPAPDPVVPCCTASANNPEDCTCWRPIFWPPDDDVDNVQLGPSRVRPTRCGDCAFRRDSPERRELDGDLPAAYTPHREFWCHDGLPKLVGFTHPNLPGVCIRWTTDNGASGIGEGDNYAAPLIEQPDGSARVWTAEGTPATVCAGWWGHARGDRAEVDARWPA